MWPRALTGDRDAKSRRFSACTNAALRSRTESLELQRFSGFEGSRACSVNKRLRRQQGQTKYKRLGRNTPRQASSQVQNTGLETNSISWRADPLLLPLAGSPCLKTQHGLAPPTVFSPIPRRRPQLPKAAWLLLDLQHLEQHWSTAAAAAACSLHLLLGPASASASELANPSA